MKKIWSAIGTKVKNCTTPAEALEAAGLDWEVAPKPMYYRGTDGKVRSVPDMQANIRSDTQAVIGIVSTRYQRVQNARAFEWTAQLKTEGATFDYMGQTRGGRRVFLVARLMEEIEILGDTIAQYVCVSTTHDGSGKFEIALLPVNELTGVLLNIGIRNAKRGWAIKHIGDLDNKMKMTAETIRGSHEYAMAVDETARKLASIALTTEKWESVCERVVGHLPEGASERAASQWQERFEALRANIKIPELKRHADNGWGAVNAVSRYLSNAVPQRKSDGWKESRFERFISGEARLDAALEEILAD